MQKMCMFVASVFAVYGMFPAYATTDIAADAESSECVENITGTYSGDANFNAKWTPNNIQLNWHDGYSGTQIIPANTSANNCNYGGVLTIPNNPPERIGYIFDGWMAHRPMMDFSTLTSLPNGQKRWAKGLYQNADYCWYVEGAAGANHVECTSDTEFRELEQHEWKVQFSTGTMYGTGHCSAKSGNNTSYTWPAESSSNWLATYDTLESTSGEKKYCWCQATGWKPASNNPENTIYGQMSVSASSAWVFYNDRSSASDCARLCAYYCSNGALSLSAFRRALATPIGN